MNLGINTKRLKMKIKLLGLLGVICILLAACGGNAEKKAKCTLLEDLRIAKAKSSMRKAPANRKSTLEFVIKSMEKNKANHIKGCMAMSDAQIDAQIKAARKR
jgi:hypothetical protein